MDPQDLHALESRRIVAREGRTAAHRQLRATSRQLGLAKDELRKLEPSGEVPLAVSNQFARSLGGVASPLPSVDRPDLSPKATAANAARRAVAKAQREHNDALAAFDAAEAELNAIEAEYAEATREPTLAEMNARAREISAGIISGQVAATQRVLDALDAADAGELER